VAYLPAKIRGGEVAHGAWASAKQEDGRTEVTSLFLFPLERKRRTRGGRTLTCPVPRLPSWTEREGFGAAASNCSPSLCLAASATLERLARFRFALSGMS